MLNSGFYLLGLINVHAFSACKEQGNAPDTRKGDNGIDYSAENGVAAAECPGNEVKLENAHKTPVEGADYRENKANFINHFFHFLKVGCFV